MERIYRSGEVGSLLPAALALVAATQFFNSILTTLVNKEYGAATTGIVTSFEIIFTWLAAVAIFHVSDVLHLQTLASLGAVPPSLSVSLLSRIQLALWKRSGPRERAPVLC